MLNRLIQKEIRQILLDFRFLTIFAICVALTVLSVYVGIQSYTRLLEQHNVVADMNQKFMHQSLVEDGNLWDLRRRGYPWSRRPEVLGTLVFGLAGSLGQEVHIQYQRLAFFQDSLFAVDPVHALFGVLDFGFVVKVILSFCALLLTYDAVCGEKEAGTLRIAASFSVPRTTLTLAKLAGSSIAVLLPLMVAFLVAGIVLSATSSLHLGADEWLRILFLLGIFGIYITIWTGFGIWISSLTHSRITAFLGLLGLWTLWIFVIPNVALSAAQWWVPVTSIYDVQQQALAARGETRKKMDMDLDAYWRQNGSGWDSLPENRRQELLMGSAEIRKKWDAVFYRRLTDLQAERQNQLGQRQDVAMMLSSLSPFSATTLCAMDFARTGPVQQRHMEEALQAYLIYMSRFIQDQGVLRAEDRKLADFAWFSYKPSEPLADCIARSVPYFLNLALLALLGFAGAYVTILRYDVR